MKGEQNHSSKKDNSGKKSWPTFFPLFYRRQIPITYGEIDFRKSLQMLLFFFRIFLHKQKWEKLCYGFARFWFYFTLYSVSYMVQDGALLAFFNHIQVTYGALG